MKYENIIEGKFISRPNRFIANVEIDGILEKVHVKNTGRLRELLYEGAQVYLEDHIDRMGTRKLRYSLIGVRKPNSLIPEGYMQVNIDSQAPNKVVKEAMLSGKLLPAGLSDVAYFKSEYKYGNSRLDFYAEDSLGNKMLGEVKGVTLEKDGTARFPDAPTERGIKHIEELIKAVSEGYRACIVFVIQLKGVKSFSPNYETHKEFGEALKIAREEGVDILAYDCIVTDDVLMIDRQVDVIL
ncbi:MAG: DNA/RNA nuclease SfsA [Bacillota bacterium]|nr:DNA/RNA nuclease SfsA [Bacillota bacterium]